MPGLLPHVDPDGLLEFSVVYTDRALNHMSKRFQGVMVDISRVLKQVYAARSAVLVPGSGTFGMEAVARQFAQDQDVLVVRNGWFSFRWSQILEQGRIARSVTVLQARPDGAEAVAAWTPCPIEEIEAEIARVRPPVVFVPHVETSAGMLMPDDWLKRIAAAVHAVDGLLVLDCIASGALWVNMADTGVDVLISAPQKGWSGSPCCAMVMLSERARAKTEATTSSSYACDLKKWLSVMETYEAGGHVYHTTMPTDALVRLREVMLETEGVGFERCREAQWALGRAVREMLQARGFSSVAGAGFQAPCVVVSHTSDPEIQNGKKFAALGLQTAAGVPLQCGEAQGFRTFRIGLFGLEKLTSPERSLNHLKRALDALA
ncbi:MAG: hypothetical protein RLY30_1644 [Pseudomonadota bacterium]|jgi:aspartate aminotransferase-like enzyme